jgi:hypothetical protein
VKADHTMSCGGSKHGNANALACAEAAERHQLSVENTRLLFHKIVDDLKTSRGIGRRPGRDAQQELEAEARKLLDRGLDTVPAVVESDAGPIPVPANLRMERAAQAALLDAETSEAATTGDMTRMLALWDGSTPVSRGIGAVEVRQALVQNPNVPHPVLMRFARDEDMSVQPGLLLRLADSGDIGGRDLAELSALDASMTNYRCEPGARAILTHPELPADAVAAACRRGRGSWVWAFTRSDAPADQVAYALECSESPEPVIAVWNRTPVDERGDLVPDTERTLAMEAYASRAETIPSPVLERLINHPYRGVVEAVATNPSLPDSVRSQARREAAGRTRVWANAPMITVNA